MCARSTWPLTRHVPALPASACSRNLLSPDSVFLAMGLPDHLWTPKAATMMPVRKRTAWCVVLALRLPLRLSLLLAGCHENTHDTSRPQRVVLDRAKRLHLRLRVDAQETRHVLEPSLTALASRGSVPRPHTPFLNGREAILAARHTRRCEAAIKPSLSLTSPRCVPVVRQHPARRGDVSYECFPANTAGSRQRKYKYERPPAPRILPPVTLAQDLRRTLPQGLRFGAIQGIIPVLFLVLPKSRVYVIPFSELADLWQFASPGSFALLLSLLVTGAIDVFASRRVAWRTRTMRAGILTCFWASFGYLLGMLLAFAGGQWELSTTPDVTVLGPSLADLLLLVIETLLPAMLLSLLFGWIGGWMGLMAPAPIPPAPHEAALSPATMQFAADNQLGQPLCFSPATSTTNVLWKGAGVIVGTILIFMVLRFSFQVGGTDLFEAAGAAIIGAIAYMIWAARKTGQTVAVYEAGVVIAASVQPAVVFRWDDLDPQRTLFADHLITLVPRRGRRCCSTTRPSDSMTTST